MGGMFYWISIIVSLIGASTVILLEILGDD